MTRLLKKQDKDLKKSSSVKWNFSKFLIGKDGQIVARFEPMTSLKKDNLSTVFGMHHEQGEYFCLWCFLLDLNISET